MELMHLLFILRSTFYFAFHILVRVLHFIFSSYIYAEKFSELPYLKTYSNVPKPFLHVGKGKVWLYVLNFDPDFFSDLDFLYEDHEPID